MSQISALLGTPREWATDLAIATGIGVFLGVLGPFGSFYGGSTELRVVFWIANMWIGFVILSTTTRLSLRAATRVDLPIWFSVAMGAAIGALPFAGFVSWFSGWFWPGDHRHAQPLFEAYGQVLAIGEPCAFAYYFLVDRGWKVAASGPGTPWLAPGTEPHRFAARRIEPAAEPVGAAPRETSSGFLDRLPPRLGRELLCLQMEDHYVRAYTPQGSDLILTSLREAMAELDDTWGLQVHRSWWVARAAVVEPVTSGRNLFLRLSNGLEAPVSRTSVAKLRAAGWLEQDELGHIR